VSEYRDKQAILIARIDRDRCDLLTVAKAEMFPRLAAVGRSVDAVAGSEIGTLQALAAADVDDVRIGRRNGEIADRASGLVVKDRLPCAAGIGRFPDAAVIDADVENIRLRWYAGGTDSAAGASRSDQSHAHILVERAVDALCIYL
jgi:hypothetical protein